MSAETRELRRRRRPQRPYTVNWECCPRCGSESFTQHLLGWDEGATQRRDPNKRGCEDCDCTWFAAEVVTPGNVG